MKKCRDCGQEKPPSEFHQTDFGKYFMSVCKDCHRAKSNVRHAQWYAQNREAACERMRLRHAQRAVTVFAHYGNECICCGATEVLFLTIDHIDNDGGEHRGAKGKHAHNTIYAWLIRKGFPPGFQLACANCNLAKRRNGGTFPDHIKKVQRSERSS